MFDSSPGLIAACRVLHRLITPRHPPCTLSSLITFVVGPHREHDKSPSRHEALLGEPLSNCFPYAIVKEPLLPLPISPSNRPDKNILRRRIPSPKRRIGIFTAALDALQAFYRQFVKKSFKILSPPRRTRKPAIRPRTIAARTRHWDRRSGGALAGNYRFYRPMMDIRPPTNAIPSAAWPRGWRRPGSNRQPLACKASALPIELRPR